MLNLFFSDNHYSTMESLAYISGSHCNVFFPVIPFYFPSKCRSRTYTVFYPVFNQTPGQKSLCCGPLLQYRPKFLPFTQTYPFVNYVVSRYTSPVYCKSNVDFNTVGAADEIGLYLFHCIIFESTGIVYIFQVKLVAKSSVISRIPL